jgi:hypothetical protein
LEEERSLPQNLVRALSSSTESEGGQLSLLEGRWVNPVGGETVEFTTGGTMIVSRGGEVLTTQLYVAEESETGGGCLGLTTEDSDAQVVLSYQVQADVLAMTYGGQTTIYRRASE